MLLYTNYNKRLLNIEILDKVTELFDMSDSLSEKQKKVLNEMPDTRENIADTLEMSYRAVRYHMNEIDEKYASLERNSNAVWSISENTNTNSTKSENNTKEKRSKEETKPKRKDSYTRAQNTKNTHNSLSELEEEVKEALSNTEPVISNYSRSSDKSTLVIPHSDAHVGAIVRDRYDVDYYSADEAIQVIREYFDKCIKSAKERGDVEDVVLIFNGDHIDGEGIYPNQRHEQEDNIRDQQRKAGKAYIEQILKLSDEFENVSVYQVPGNHGRLDRQSTTNFDMMLYDFIETGIYYSPVENVHIEKAGPGGFINFSVRGWDYHCRHGEGMLEHIGTSSGKNRAKNHFMQYKFDIMLRSHFHGIKYETIGDNIPVVMTGSPAPQSTFAEERSAGGGKCGVHWFTTNDEVIEKYQPMNLKTKHFQ